MRTHGCTTKKTVEGPAAPPPLKVSGPRPKINEHIRYFGLRCATARWVGRCAKKRIALPWQRRGRGVYCFSCVHFDW